MRTTKSLQPSAMSKSEPISGAKKSDLGTAPERK